MAIDFKFVLFSKLRHAAVILAEAESTLGMHTKMIGMKRVLLTQFDNKLYEIKETKVKLSFNQKTNGYSTFCISTHIAFNINIFVH